MKKENKPDLLNGRSFGTKPAPGRKMTKEAAARKRQYLLDNKQQIDYQKRSYNGDQFNA